MHRLKFVIICPAARAFRVDDQNKKPSRRMKIFRVSMLSALYVAASAPDDVETKIIDENIEPIDLDTDADIIGISFMTFNAPRAYELAAAFKERGKTVIFGGYHPTLMSQEAIGYCDAVCVGDAEGNVPKMIADFRDGKLKKFYRYQRDTLAKVEVNNRLINQNQYIVTSVVQATRGCPNLCEFCAVSAFFKNSHRTKPIDDIVGEIKKTGKKHIVFIDDNIGADVLYARKLFEKLTPLKKRWYAQIGVNVAEDPEHMSLLKKSGCRGVLVGFESLNQESLNQAAKAFNRASEYRKAIQVFHAYGIYVFGCFVLGFDQDQREIFEITARFLKEAKVDGLQLTVQTPFPGTPLFKRMELERRIFDRNWEHYDFGHVVFRPRNMSAEELQMAHNRILREFYSLPSIIIRFIRQLRYLAPREIVLSLMISVGYRFKLRETLRRLDV
jgi:radical SAM superfamily enzyme YgiQ (UPF0313 family)